MLLRVMCLLLLREAVAHGGFLLNMVVVCRIMVEVSSPCIACGCLFKYVEILERLLNCLDMFVPLGNCYSKY